MAIVEIPGGVFLPAPIQWEDSAVPGFTTYTLDTTNRKVSFILHPPKSGKIESFEFKIGTVSQVPTNGLKVSFQDVSGGVPDNVATYYYTITSGNIASNTWTIPPYLTDDGTSGGNRKTISRTADPNGAVNFLACVIEFASFSIGDSVVIQVLTQDKYAPKGAYILTADILDAWTKVAGIPVMALVYEGSDYVQTSDTYAAKSIDVVTINPSTSPDEIMLAFTIPAPMRIGGAYVLVDPSDLVIITLFDSETGEVKGRTQKQTYDYYANSHNVDYIFVRFGTDILLQANKIYWLGVVSVATMDVYFLSAYSASQMASLPGGATWHYLAFEDETFMAEDATKRPIFGLLVTGVDHDISGGSGGPGWEGNP